MSKPTVKDNYLEYKFRVDPIKPAAEILIAELAALGFESFVESEDGVSAYIQKGDWNEALIQEVGILTKPEFKITYEFTELAKENWNAVWEANFEPIAIEGLCTVRAPFHKRREAVYDIVIEPKMSFGTGHHETTYMMLQLLLDINCKEKKVLDMGCGTGVLAILAAMKGAKAVDAIDVDPWAYQNTQENTLRNTQEGIKVRQGDVNLLREEMYDCILANINRNILLEDISQYSMHLVSGGLLCLSGFYQDDLPLISAKCAQNGLEYIRQLSKNSWVAAVYRFS